MLSTTLYYSLNWDTSVRSKLSNQNIVWLTQFLVNRIGHFLFLWNFERVTVFRQNYTNYTNYATLLLHLLTSAESL